MVQIGIRGLERLAFTPRLVPGLTFNQNLSSSIEEDNCSGTQAVSECAYQSVSMWSFECISG
jgi:hypothetical protein